jgi:hydrogenase nickel incorporation protein HypA/HybF
MHEASIAMNILDTLIAQCERDGYGKITEVQVQIGAAANVLPESLSFTFDIVKRETIAREAQLRIDLIPVGGHCPGCKREFTTEAQYIWECPFCATPGLEITQGSEIRIVSMEVE